MNSMTDGCRNRLPSPASGEGAFGEIVVGCGDLDSDPQVATRIADRGSRISIPRPVTVTVTVLCDLRRSRPEILELDLQAVDAVEAIALQRAGEIDAGAGGKLANTFGGAPEERFE